MTRAGKLAIGTYRLLPGVQAHEQAVVRALSRGIRVIDTSPTYGDGGCERLVAKAVGDAGLAGDSSLAIISKFGYLQGEALEKHRAAAGSSSSGPSYSETVDFDPTCSHCLSPDFMADQLTGSLERLETDRLDCFLMHNPEHLLLDRVHAPTSLPEAGATDGIPSPGTTITSSSGAGGSLGANSNLAEEAAAAMSLTASVLEARADLQARMRTSFEALEEEVKRGRIRTYGISSNSFSVAASDPHFLPYDWLLEAAEEAAQRAGNAAHSFSTVELPINMLEREGLAGCAAWASGNGIRVLASRPLTAFHPMGTFRLAEAAASSFSSSSASSASSSASSNAAAVDAFARARNETLEYFTPPALEPGQAPTEEEEETAEACAFFRDLVIDLERGLPHFTSVADYERAIQDGVIPRLTETIDGMDDTSAQQLDTFFRALGEAVRWQCAGRARELVAATHPEAAALGLQQEQASGGGGPAAPLQDVALGWLADQQAVDHVLVGMTKPEYVDEAFEIFSKPS